MAKTVSEEEIQLRKRARRRLVGAIAMVIAAVVILPMVLDSQPEQRDQDIDIFIPSEDEVAELAPEAENPEEPAVSTAPAPQGKPAAEIRPAPANPAPPPQKKPLAETPVSAAPRPQEKSPTEKPRQVAPGSAAALGGMDTRLREPPGEQSGASSQTASDSVPDAKSKSPSVNAPGGEAKFVVQSGAFSNPEKAEQQLRRLEAYDISAYSEAFRSGRYEITRVRIGPYSTREEAERMSKQLKKLGFGAVVTEK